MTADDPLYSDAIVGEEIHLSQVICFILTGTFQIDDLWPRDGARKKNQNSWRAYLLTFHENRTASPGAGNIYFSQRFLW